MRFTLWAFVCLWAVPTAWAQSQLNAINISWLPVTDAEKQLTAPKVDKDAGVEAIFWNVHLVDEVRGQDLQRLRYNYVRLKVFSEAGKEKASTIEIPSDEETVVLSVSGRTIKADGSILELKGDDVHERDVYRIGKLRQRVKSFAMPGVEPGAIVEYRWREVQNSARFKYARLQFQREFPIQKVTYYIKPLSHDLVAMPRMSFLPFNCRPAPLNLDNRGFSVTSIENVPAFKEEPMMPAEPNVRAWALVLYHDGGKREKDEYWDKVGKHKYKELKRSLKISPEVEAATAKAIDGSTEGDRVIAILRFIRKNIRNLFDPSVPDAQRAQILKQLDKSGARPAAEILASGLATASEMNLLFAAMATQAGFEARPALVADRQDIYFNERLLDEYFLPSVDMAIKHGEQWRLYDASTHRLPAHMVSWREEGTPALLSDPKAPQFIKSPVSPPDASVRRRVAQLTLAADGSVSGEIEESYTGHLAADRRTAFERESAEKQQEIVRDEIQGVFASAEVSDIAVENVAESEEPLKIRYKIAIEGYAEVAGKRIFFAPMFFQRGERPLFSASERKYDVHFRFAWTESDDVEFHFPSGFQLDNPDTPPNLKLGGAGSYGVFLRRTADGGLRCTREFVFGNNEALSFAQATYPRLKAAFDEVHRRDQHVMAVKQ